MHKPEVAAEVAEDMEVVAPEAIWAALAEATSAASAEVASVALAEVAWAVSAEVTWRACTAITLAREDVISLVAAFTTTALIAKITRHIAGRTPAPIERRAGSAVADARLSLSPAASHLNWRGNRLLTQASHPTLDAAR